ncbi:MAG TPA: UvrD-helicase domain-containing protein [Solirubrobacteraceae bacterium]
MTVADAEHTFTSEQLDAIERRDGTLFLAAGAGSGKTSVLVERFVRSVLEDGIDVAAILTITFTEKAAAEMRERIRARLRELSAVEQARATEGAAISTIHGFCARLLRANALAAGIDPSFTVLDELESRRLADEAFDGAIQSLAEDAVGGVELIAAYGADALRSAIRGIYGELRSRGQTHPVLPALPAPPDAAEIDGARRELEAAAATVAAQLGAVAEPSAKVVEALARLAPCSEITTAVDPWPADLERLRLPSGNGAALTTAVCCAYREALDRYTRACELRWASRARNLLDALLSRLDERYARLKRRASALDFEDLELLSRDLLREDTELRDRYRERFARVMVDELQDTNAVQLELIDAISHDNLFAVGDARQSIYAFRHADVELFERRGEEAATAGARATLRTNFRTRPEVLEVINRAFEALDAEPLLPGREAAGFGEPLVELLIADKGADWSKDGPAAPWRVAEARALARRIAELVADGAAPRDVVVLLRATADMRTYERALEERGVPTYVIGGRGYWSHPQVVDLVSYLQTLANPRDEVALYSVLASPLVGASVDALVVLGAASRTSNRNVWWVLDDPGDLLDELAEDDAARLARFAAWLRAERAEAARLGVEELIERVLERTGYDLEVLSLPGGQRRLANVRKLMRLGREHAAAHGPDLHGFLELVGGRMGEGGGDPHASEAPVESEALDAVRLMTIHRAKGLEFEIVCVADLGRGPWGFSPLIRVGRDGRLGLRLSRPGTERPFSTLAHAEIGEQAKAAAADEERRLFYVAMTRARERLILSGAANLAGSWGNGSGAPIGWLGPALVPGLVDRVEEGSGVADGVRFTFVVDAEDRPQALSVERAPRPAVGVDDLEHPHGAQARPRSRVGSLSYSSLATYHRCGYRFYAERVLALPGTPVEGAGGSAGALTPAERGSAVHTLLERLDFRRPLRPTPAAIAAAAARPPTGRETTEIGALIERFGGSEICARLARATRVAREQPFAFALGQTLVTGALDVVATEQTGSIVVDYKTDRLEGRNPAAVVEREYETQRLIYALAVLSSGAPSVEVAHVFLEAPENPVVARYETAERAGLERELAGLAAGVLQERFTVTEEPYREICQGCPAEGGLCSWPLAMTRRQAPDRLF